MICSTLPQTKWLKKCCVFALYCLPGMFSTTASSTPGEALSFEQCDTVADALTYSAKCDSPHLEEVKVSCTLPRCKSHQCNAKCFCRYQSPSDLFYFATFLSGSG